MASKGLANLAVMGIIGASVVGCGGEPAPAPTGEMTEEAAKASKIKAMEKREASGSDEPAPPPPSEGGPDPVEYAEVHSCAGLNSCKGLGGCAVSEEALTKMAAARGIPLEEAGEAHSCAGLNACKGLGGCKVTDERLAELKEKLGSTDAGVAE